MLLVVGDHNVEVIKAVREITGLGLKGAKDLVEDAPSIVKESVSWSEAEAIKTALERVGAKAAIQPHRWSGNGQYASQYAEAGNGA